MIEDMIMRYAELGFAFGVSGFLLWKGYKQDERYIIALERIETLLRHHIEQKDRALQLLEKRGLD